MNFQLGSRFTIVRENWINSMIFLKLFWQSKIRFCSEKYSILYPDLTWWTLIAMQCQGCIYVSTKKSYFIGLKKNSAIFANFCTQFSPLVLSSFQISTPYGAQGPCLVFNSISPSLVFFPLLFPIFWIKAIAKGCCVCATLLLAPV